MSTPLRVTYRSVFKGPIGILNPAGFPCSKIAMTVEVYPAKNGHWKAREMDTGKKRDLPIPDSCMSAESARLAIMELFTSCELPWQMWGDPPATEAMKKAAFPERLLQGTPRLIHAEEVEVRDDRVYMKQEAKTR